jgi:hypothetical protein
MVGANRKHAAYLWAPIETLNIFVCKFVLLGLQLTAAGVDGSNLRGYTDENVFPLLNMVYFKRII